MTPKRKQTIKIRVTEGELRSLREKCDDQQLAKWMREKCLAQESIKKRRTSKVDPDLLRQLVAIGNNLNQIARVVNRDQWVPVDRIAVCVQLAAIEEQLEKIQVSK